MQLVYGYHEANCLLCRVDKCSPLCCRHISFTEDLLFLSATTKNTGLFPCVSSISVAIYKIIFCTSLKCKRERTAHLVWATVKCTRIWLQRTLKVINKKKFIHVSAHVCVSNELVRCVFGCSDVIVCLVLWQYIRVTAVNSGGHKLFLVMHGMH